MEKDNNKLKRYSIISVSCVFAAVLLSFLNLIRKDYSLYGNYFEWIGNDHNYEDFFLRYLPALKLVAYIMIACSVLLKKKSLLSGSLAAIPVIYILAYLEHFFFELKYSFLLYLAYIFLVIIVVVSQKNAESAKKMCFIPAISLFANLAYALFRAFVDNKETITSLNKMAYGSDLFIVVAFVFIGLWTVTYVEPKKQTQAMNYLQQPVFESQANQIHSNDPDTPDDTDRLLKLKELLDSGAITQQEFEEKKKQILNI